MDVKLVDVEAAVTVAFDPATPSDPVAAEHKRRAQAYCTNLANAPGSWRVCMDMLDATAVPAAKFLCLQAIERAARTDALTQPERVTLRGSLVGFVTRRAATIATEEAYVKNKVALLLVLLLQRDVLDAWQSAVQDLLGQLSSSAALADIMLRVLTIFDEEVVKNTMNSGAADHARHQAIKDHLRRCGALQALSLFWLQVFTAYRADVSLCDTCLQTMRTFIPWIDIGLVVNDKFMPLFYDFLTNADLRESVCECLYEVVHKGMDDVARVKLVSELRLVEVISRLPMDPSSPDDEDFASEVAELVCSIGQGLVASGCVTAVVSRPELVDATAKQLVPAIELALRLLDADSVDVSECLFPLVDDMLSCLKRERAVVDQAHGRMGVPVAVPMPPPAPPVLAPDGRSVASGSTDGRHNKTLFKHGNGCPANVSMHTYTPRLLEILLRRMRYPDDHDFRPGSEAEAEWGKYRQGLRKALTNMTRAVPEVVLPMVSAALTPKLPVLGKLPFNDAELALYVLQLVGEGNPKLAKGPLEPLIVAVHSSDVIAHPHHIVLLAYFELASRFGAVLRTRPELLPKVLQAMLGPSGLQHSHPAVRSRAAYLFLKLLKTIVSDQGVMEPILQPLLRGLSDFLTVDAKAGLNAGDRAYLFEAAGLMVGQAWLAPDVALGPLTAILSPLLSQLSNGLKAAATLPGGTVPADAVEPVGEWASRLLTAVARVAKGFTRALSGPLAVLFVTCVDAAGACLVALPGHAATRNTVRFLLHRMVQVLGPPLLPKLGPLLPFLVTVSNAKDLCDALSFVNNALSTFKAAASDMLVASLLPVVKQVFAVLPPADSPAQSDEARDRLLLQRAYFGMLNVIVDNELAPVLLSPAIAPHMFNLLGTVAQGLAGVPDAPARKLCCSMFTTLLSQWLPSGRPSADGPGTPLSAAQLQELRAFLWDTLAPALFQSTLQPDFNVQDAGCLAVCVSLIQLQVLLLARCPPDPAGRGTADHFLTSVLPAVGVSGDGAQQYLKALGDNAETPRAFLPWFVQLVKQLRTSRGLA